MKSYLKKTLAIFCAALVSCGCLTSCGEQKLPEPTDTLGLHSPMRDDRVHWALMDFIAQNPHIKNVEYTDIIWDGNLGDGMMFGGNSIRWHTAENETLADDLQQYYDNMKKDLMKNRADDVVFADTGYQHFSTVIPVDFNKLMDCGAFLDLIPLFEKYAPDFDLTPYQSLMTKDGKLYTIPATQNVFYLSSGEKVLAEWNFPCDTEDNVLEFLRKCKDWKDQNVNNPDAPEVFSQPAWQYLYYNLFDILGLSYRELKESKASVNTPEVIECLSILRELRSDIEEPTLQDLQALNDTYGKFLFGCHYGTYDVTYTAYDWTPYSGDPMQLMPLRRLDGKANVQANMYMMIPTGSKNAANAAMYLSEAAVRVDWNQNNEKYGGWEISSFDAENAKVVLEDCRQQWYVTADFKDTVWDLYEDKGDICMPSYWMVSLRTLFDDFMRGAYTPEKFLEDVDSRLRIYLSE